MRNKNVVNIFGCFLTFGKMLSFHIATKSDRLSRVIIKFVVYSKNFMFSSFKQKKIQLVWSKNDGDIQIFFWSVTFRTPCIYAKSINFR